MAEGTLVSETYAAHSTEPLENPLVIERICGFLPTADLFNCRLVNLKWNSASVWYLRKRATVIDFRYHRSVKSYVEFINSRNREIEWYERDIRYKLIFTSDLIQSVESLIAQFGPECLHTVNVDLTASEYDSEEYYPQHAPEEEKVLCNWIEKTIQGARLEKLKLETGTESSDYWPQQVAFVAQILHSPSTIRKLTLDSSCWYMEYRPADTDRLPGLVLKTLQDVPAHILNTIEQLKVDIAGNRCLQPLCKIQLPSLKRVKLVVLQEEEDDDDFSPNIQYPNSMPAFSEFLRNCSTLTHCAVDMGSLTTDELYPLQREKRNISAAFPGITFDYFASDILRSDLDYSD